jgi:hypothetical protein
MYSRNGSHNAEAKQRAPWPIIVKDQGAIEFDIDRSLLGGLHAHFEMMYAVPPLILGEWSH